MALILTATTNPGTASWQNATDVVSGAFFQVQTTEWSSAITGVTPGLQQFDQSLVVPAGTVAVGRTLEIKMDVVAIAAADSQIDLQINGVSLVGVGGFPLKFSAGFWPETWVARITNAGPTSGPFWGATDTIITNTLSLLVDSGTGSENSVVSLSNTPLGPPLFDPAVELTITAHWRNAIDDGTAYLRHLSARLL